MRSEADIYKDYDKALEQANRLRRVATSVTAIGNEELANILNDVSLCWSGENADSYIAKGEATKTRIITVGDEIEKFANMIEVNAERSRDAELSALRA